MNTISTIGAVDASLGGALTSNHLLSGYYERLVNLSSCILRIDVAGTVVFANDLFCRLSGYTQEELISHTMPVWQGDFSPQHLFSDFWATLKVGFIWQGEIKGFTKDNQFYWLDVIVTPVLQTSGDVVGFFIVGHDITQKKYLEERVTLLESQLKLSLDPAVNVRDTILQFAEVGREMVEKTAQIDQSSLLSYRLKMAMESAHIGVWEWDIQKDELIWDAKTYELYGINREDYLFQQCFSKTHWLKRLHPEDAPIIEQKLKEALAARGHFDVVFRICPPLEATSVAPLKACWRFLRVIADNVEDISGRFPRMIGVTYDVTKLYEAEQWAAYHQLRYQLVIQGAGVGIWDFNIETNEMYASAKFYQMLGYQENEFLLTLEKFFDLLHLGDRFHVSQCLQQHLQMKEIFDVECLFKTKPGEYRWFRCTGLAAFDTNNYPTRMVGSIQDIHKNKVYEQKLKRSNEDLDQFAYIASHDLREPLRGMQNFSQFLLEDFHDRLDEEGVLYLETIKKLGERLEAYLDSLLYYARFDREGMAYKETNLGDLLYDVIDMVKVASPDKSIIVNIHAVLPIIRCDRNKMREIFSNLFRNAVKYTVATEKKIDIYYRSLGEGEHEFSLKDNGIGIVPALQGMIFTLFKRLHPKEAFGGGVGMGLTIVKRAVERHGGRIWVESDGVNGSTFYFTVKESDGHGF